MVGKFCVLIFVIVAAVESAPPSKNQVSEAEQIALESSGELLAPPELVSRIEADLKQIRSKFPDVADVKHGAKWTPGEVIVNKATKEKIDLIPGSSLGAAQSKSLFQNKIFLVAFEKPYNPEKVAEVLKKELGLEDVNPNGNIGGSESIELKRGDTENTYTFKKGSGDCLAGCINKRFYEFTVGPDADSAKLVKEWDN